MSNNKSSGMFAGKGYYIALILCAAAIGITGYLYYQNANEVQEVSVQETVTDDILVGTLDQEDVAVVSTQPNIQTNIQSTTPAVQGTVPAPAGKTSLKTMSPVAGEGIFDYSMEALSYNQTTRDWRVHNGIDLAAEDGEQVVAAADGEVYTVYEDDTMGYTVVIRHNGGYTSKYSCLAENIAVRAGEKVTMGQVIGYAGSTAIVESALGSHVHFSVSYLDEPMNPADFLAQDE